MRSEPRASFRLTGRARPRRLGVGAVLCAVALVGLAAPVTAAGRPTSGPASDPGVVEGSYIVTLQPGNDPKSESGRLSRRYGGRAGHVYEHALSGFSFEGSEQAAAALARNPKVRSVVADREVSITGQVVPTGIERIDGPLSGTVSGNGSGAVDVDIAIIDTGIDLAHPDLNVVGGTNCSRGNGYDDGNGHGTHTAGTAAAKDDGVGVVGVAPGARLWAVRVLDNRGSGTWSSVICGIDWVTGHADVIEVANMSLGGSGSEGSCSDGGLHQAVCASVNAGVTYAVAAGNEAEDAAKSVPASYDEVITVSALADFDGLPGGLGSPTCRADQDDTLADFSNFGADVDLIAPGVCISSTWKGGGYNTISGTSMAAPHVAGAAALFRSDNPGAGPADVKAALLAGANLNWNAGDDPDHLKEPLLNVAGLTGTTIGGGGTSNTAPVAGFTVSCTGLDCSFTDTSTDPDGTITGWSWSFGDGGTDAVADPVHTFASAGTFPVTLTVTDNGGATGSATQPVEVSVPPPPGAFTLAATGYKVKGLQKVDLAWSGANGTVDISRNGVLIRSAVSGTALTDNIDTRGGGSYSYQACQTTGGACSNPATVTF